MENSNGRTLMFISVCTVKNKYEILDYYANIVDKVTDRFSNKEILLLCSRF